MTDAAADSEAKADTAPRRPVAALRPVRASFVPLLDCASLVVAHELGFAAEAGIDLQLQREMSWASVRDKLYAGRTDVAHVLAGLSIAASLGITMPAQAVIAPICLGLNGNAITVSSRLFAELQDAGFDGSAPDPHAAGQALAAVVARRKAAGLPPLTFSSVFPVSSHNYALRYWLAASGIAVDTDIILTIVPPPFTAEALSSGRIDGFCVGEPWSSVAVEQAGGHIIAFGSRIWRRGVEKVLGCRQDWADANHNLLQDLIRVLDRAARWADAPENKPELARILAAPHYVNHPAGLLLRGLTGEMTLSANGPAFSDPDFLLYHRTAANFPWKSQALWIYSQMVRWGQITHAPENIARVEAVFRPDLYRQALRGTATDLPGASAKVEGALAIRTPVGSNRGHLNLGPDSFFDGRIFDPSAFDAYIAGFSSNIPTP